MAEDKDGVWELVDGLQRVSTFISFFGELKGNGWKIDHQEERGSSLVEEEEEIEEENGEGTEEKKTINKWTLQEGGLVKSLQGFNVDSLPPNLKINLKKSCL